MSAEAEHNAMSIIDGLIDDMFQWGEIRFNPGAMSSHEEVKAEDCQNDLKFSSEGIGLLNYFDKTRHRIWHSLEFSDARGEKMMLHHIEVLQQVVFNLCGYHMLYNIVACLKILNAQDLAFPNLLLAKPLFWKFHRDCGNFLLRYATEKQLLTKSFPWNYISLKLASCIWM